MSLNYSVAFNRRLHRIKKIAESRRFIREISRVSRLFIHVAYGVKCARFSLDAQAVRIGAYTLL